MKRRRARRTGVAKVVSKRSIAVAALIGAAFLAWAVPFYAPGMVKQITSLFRQDPPQPPPVQVTVAPEFSSIWLFPSTRSALGDPPAEYCDTNEYRRWLRTAKATPTFNDFGVVLRANTDATVIVEGMSIRVLKRLRPLGGILLDCPIGGGGGGVGPIGFATINFDHARPSIAYTDAYGEPTKRLTFRLEKGIDQHLSIRGESETSFVTWEASLLLTVDGQRQPFRLRDPDTQGPFSLTPRNGGSTTYLWGGDQWIRRG